MVTDGFAHIGNTLHLGLHHFEDLHDFVKERLKEDIDGLLRPRFIVC